MLKVEIHHTVHKLGAITIDEYFDLNYSKTIKDGELRAKKYHEYLSSINLDLDLMLKKDLLPNDIKKIKLLHPEFNEKVDFLITNYLHDDNENIITFYFRSIRSKSVIIENISSKILKNLAIDVKVYKPKNIFELRAGNDRNISNKYKSETIKFPIEYLKPNESIVFPIEIKLVPEKYASAYIYESDIESNFNILEVNYNSFIQEVNNTNNKKIQSKNKVLNKIKEEIKRQKEYLNIEGVGEKYFYTKYNDVTEPIDVGSEIIIKNISFKVDGDNKLQNYTRQFNPKNLIYINDNCECGSCPTLFAKNKNNKWRRLREIIVNHKNKINENDFIYELPTTSKEVKIEEYRGETSYLSNLKLIIQDDNKQYEYSLSSKTKIVQFNKAFKINLHNIQKKHQNINKIYLKGKGYYETNSSTLCNTIKPLDFKYF